MVRSSPDPQAVAYGEFGPTGAPDNKPTMWRITSRLSHSKKIHETTWRASNTSTMPASMSHCLFLIAITAPGMNSIGGRIAPGAKAVT